MYEKCFTQTRLVHIMKSIQATLKLADDKDEAMNHEIVSFITKASQIFFKAFISDPKLLLDLSSIG